MKNNSETQVVKSYAYDAYGSLLSHDRFDGSVNQPYQYVGQLGYYTHWMEPDFELLLLGVRFYDAAVGRFSQRDAARDGLDFYTYADGNPAWYVDPTGNFAIVIASGCAIGAAELALAFGAVASIACGSNEDCRQAVAEAAQAMHDAIMNVLRAGLRCCNKAIKLRCTAPWRWNHKKHRHPFPQKDGKICWQNHIQIDCHLAGIPKSDMHIRIPYGPCYKHRTGPKIW